MKALALALLLAGCSGIHLEESDMRLCVSQQTPWRAQLEEHLPEGGVNTANCEKK